MEKLKQKAGLVILAMTPAISYLIFEWITGNLSQVKGIYILLNLAIFYAVYGMTFALTNRMRISLVLWNAIFTFWALAEYFVVEFRDRPIMLWDILAFRTAMTVSGNYQYTLTPKLVTAIVLMAVWSVLLCLFPVKISNLKIRITAAVSSIVMSAVFFAALFQVGFLKFGIEINMWEPTISFAQYGYMVSSLRIIDYSFVEKPEGYSTAYIKEIREEIEAEKENAVFPWKSESDVVPTNIICIMNESYADLQVIAPFETDVPYMEFYNSLEENTVKGSLYMPVFGAMTSNSEYEMLTGNAIAFAPEGSVPYQIYMKDPTPSLARILKGQGYRAVAMHPNEAWNWNRTEAYTAMGFDAFYDIAFYEDAPLVRNYVSDKGDFEKIIKLTEEKEPGEPLFIFNVTMQNHGGYEDEFESTVHLTEYENMPMTEQYLSLIRESDKALEELISYYSNVEEPTMIIMFGDHQPGIEQEFYEALYGRKIEHITLEEVLRRYITPFLIWTNYPTGSMTDQHVSAQYLSCAILQRANLEMTDYLYFLNEMYQAAPVVHLMGYYTKNMEFENWDNWREKKEYPIFHRLEMLQYHNMFEKSRINSIFMLPES